MEILSADAMADIDLYGHMVHCFFREMNRKLAGEVIGDSKMVSEIWISNDKGVFHVFRLSMNNVEDKDEIRNDSVLRGLRSDPQSDFHSDQSNVAGDNHVIFRDTGQGLDHEAFGFLKNQL